MLASRVGFAGFWCTVDVCSVCNLQCGNIPTQCRFAVDAAAGGCLRQAQLETFKLELARVEKERDTAIERADGLAAQIERPQHGMAVALACAARLRIDACAASLCAPGAGLFTAAGFLRTHCS